MKQDIHSLTTQFGNVPGLTFHDRDGQIYLTLETELCTLQIFLQGAHITHFQAKGQPPLLFMSSGARYGEEVALRGGIPLIFPWFGARRDRRNADAHGFARNLTWRLTDAQAGPEPMLVLELTASDRTRLEWPHEFRLRYYIYPARDLTLSWEIENLDERSFVFEAALHTYFAVPGVEQCHVQGLDGTRYLEQLSGESRVQTGDVFFTGETDNIYFNVPETLVLSQGAGESSVSITSNALSAIVWNPWVDKAQRMQDFGDDEWPHMLCIESGAVRENEIQLLPGETATLSVSYARKGSAEAASSGG